MGYILIQLNQTYEFTPLIQLNDDELPDKIHLCSSSESV